MMRAAWAVLAAALSAAAEEEPPRLDLRLSLKSTALVERKPSDAQDLRERNGGAGLWRLRLDGAALPAPWAELAAAWETRLRVESAGPGGGAGLLPPEGPAPWRVRPLDWPIAAGPGLSWRHELDRASLLVSAGALRLTLGRQAIGWGRGTFFGALDLFAPFAPLEVDREWRRGVDAARAELKLGARAAAEAVVAGRAGEGAAAARVRGAAGDADGELVAGWRDGDWLLGAGASGALLGAELHGEICAVRAREAGSEGDARLAFLAVAGASRRLPLGSGLLLLAEVHHSGLGARRTVELGSRLADPAFQRRLLRGDVRVAGRWAAAVSGSAELSPLLSASLALLVSPADGSGAAAPRVRLDLSDRLSLTAGAVLPWGAAPDGGGPRSEYGATPVSGLVQLALYE